MHLAPLVSDHLFCPLFGSPINWIWILSSEYYVKHSWQEYSNYTLILALKMWLDCVHVSMCVPQIVNTHKVPLDRIDP